MNNPVSAFVILSRKAERLPVEVRWNVTTPGNESVQKSRRVRRTVWVGTAVGIIVVAGAIASIPLVSAGAGTATKSKDKVVVQVVTRTPSGTTSPVSMLATVKGASLYTAPSSGCTGGCLNIWPPLYVAKGKTPTGVNGLGTLMVTIGKRHKFQVTYLGKPLYTFVDDSGSSANGNGVAGFMAAVVS